MKDFKHIKRFNESEENLNISDVRRSFSFTYDDLKTAFEEGWKDYSNNWYGGRDKGEPNFEEWFNDWFKKNYV
jgi:hypothetical protein